MKKIIGILICMLLIATAVPAVTSQNNKAITVTVSDTKQSCILTNWNETQKLITSDGVAGDNFGVPISLDGDTALIGAAYDDSDKGSAYVFTCSGATWTQQAKLTASDGAAGDYFGFGSLDGDTALIGAAGDDTDRGSAYVFTRTGTTWTQQQKLVASDGAAYDVFGYSISLDGDVALIGAFCDDSEKGSAYIFVRNGTTWTQQQKLIASDGIIGDWFGYSVSLKGETALIGTYDAESAYVFIYSGTTWTQQAKLIASDGTAGDNFGLSISFDGNTALIGAYGDDDKGSAYVFTCSGATWTQQAKLTASDGATGDQFGYDQCVSVDGDTALIGANMNDGNGSNSGSAYVFTRTGTTWTQQAKLLASDSTAGDSFGFGVSLDGDTAFIGATGDDDNGIDSGSAYVFIKESENQPPINPTITGPSEGKIKVATDYNFTTTDPDGDEVYYFIDWDDQTNSSWIGPYPSGDVVNKSHTWSKKGDYTIKAKAKDINGNESDWGTLSVTMPYSHNLPFMQFWMKLLERFPHAFPILRHFLGY